MPEIKDADFTGELSAGVTSRAAWGLTAPEVEALGLGPEVRLLSLEVERGARGVLRVAPMIQAEAALFVPYFDPAGEGASLAAAVGRLARLAHAVLYVQGEFTIHAPERQSRGLVEEGTPLRAGGLFWCEQGEALGWVPKGRTLAIRSGSGFVDLARDLVALAGVLTPVWPKLAAVQALLGAGAPPEAAALKETDLARMDELGTQLQQLLSGDDTTRPWYRELVGASQLLAATYGQVHNAWAYHRQKVNGEAPPTLHGLAR